MKAAAAVFLAAALFLVAVLFGWIGIGSSPPAPTGIELSRGVSPTSGSPGRPGRLHAHVRQRVDAAPLSSYGGARRNG